jgi:hypothetical protein
VRPRRATTQPVDRSFAVTAAIFYRPFTIINLHEHRRGRPCFLEIRITSGEKRKIRIIQESCARLQINFPVFERLFL